MHSDGFELTLQKVTDFYPEKKKSTCVRRGLAKMMIMINSLNKNFRRKNHQYQLLDLLNPSIKWVTFRFRAVRSVDDYFTSRTDDFHRKAYFFYSTIISTYKR